MFIDSEGDLIVDPIQLFHFLVRSSISLDSAPINEFKVILYRGSKIIRDLIIEARLLGKEEIKLSISG